MRDESDNRPFDELSVPKKILHVQDLWDQIANSPEGVDLTAAQRTELERRLRSHEETPGDYTTWEELRHRLEGRAR